MSRVILSSDQMKSYSDRYVDNVLLYSDVIDFTINVRVYVITCVEHVLKML